MSFLHKTYQSVSQFIKHITPLTREGMGVGLCGLLLTSCSDFTEITPKGVNMLQKATDLEMLLNQQYSGDNIGDSYTIMGYYYYAYSPIPATILQANKTRQALLYSLDESMIDRIATLTSSDSEYNFFYGNVGKIANPILTNIDGAIGDEDTKKKVKAEALCMRAWSEWMAVSKYAKAYNPQTAANTSGVPYLMEDWDITVPTQKATVAEVYEKALADVDAAIALNAMPSMPSTKYRFSQAFAYALKAYLCASMQNWDKAKEAANQALAINGEVMDYWSPENTGTRQLSDGSMSIYVMRPRSICCEDYFTTDYLVMGPITQEGYNAVEDGSFIRERVNVDDATDDQLTERYGFHVSKAVYDNSFGWNFYGLKTTQMYMLLAEAEVVAGNYDAAMDYLDKVRCKHINPAKYQPLKGTNVDKIAAIKHVKETAIAENMFSYYNFVDQKRWNQMSGWEATIVHNFDDMHFELKPDGKLWIFPFPKNVVDNNPNLTHNYLE